MLIRGSVSTLSLAAQGRPVSEVFGSLRLRTDATTATADADYAQLGTLPASFGTGEFTFAVWVRLETLTAGPGGGTSLTNWFNGNPTRYGAADWWFSGNFLVDGFNNTTYQNGSFAIQFFNSGCPRWTFGDGTNVPLGSVWAMQNASYNIRDSNWHLLVCVRRWNGVSNADLELWGDGTLRDTQTSSVRTNMQTNYWSAWTGFPEPGWTWGAEKRHIFSAGGYWDDYKGNVGRMLFYDRALSTGEIGSLGTTVPTSGLVGDYRMRQPDGLNRIYSDVVGTQFISCVARSAGPIWVSEAP